MRNLGAVGETCETLCETSYGETLRFKHEPCTCPCESSHHIAQHCAHQKMPHIELHSLSCSYLRILVVEVVSSADKEKPPATAPLQFPYLRLCDRTFPAV